MFLRSVAALLVLLASAAVVARAADRPATAPADYLATWKLDRPARAALEAPGPWDEEKLQVCLRLLARLALAPPDALAAWSEAAAAVGGTLPEPGDGFVRFEGRALFAAPLALPPEQAEIANRPALDLVRVKTAAGLVDVIADAIPKAWPRWQPLDEPVTVTGLPISTAPGPRPEPQVGAPAAWPTEPAGLLVVARRVAWHPATPLGTLGMDYGLFDTVVDGQKLVVGDTEAFYAVLAAAGRIDPAAVAGPPADIVPLINPQGGWFTRHRGEPVTVEGVARRATRIEIDDPFRRQQVGVDHYWELYVFVPTPLLEVHDRLQEDYPVVCCVRTLPDGMPTGPQIGERVRVTGFALKRYRYPLPDVKISSSRGESERQGLRQDTCLLVGGAAVWRPQATPDRAIDTLGWVFTGLAALIGAALAVAAWAFARDARRRERQARRELPERIEVP